MEIEYDPNKNALNLKKHGIALSFAAFLDWDNALVWVDDRFHYDELRLVGLVPHENTLYTIAYAERGEIWRIISLRRAERREVEYYVDTI
jgi:uncharacterized DUF497 family protein